MILGLIVRPDAEADMAQAQSWYNAQRPGLGDQFVDSVEEALNQIQSMPRAAPDVFQGVRRVRLRRFPYGIFYRIRDDLIEVLAVYHTGRDPRGWQART